MTNATVHAVVAPIECDPVGGQVNRHLFINPVCSDVYGVVSGSLLQVECARLALWSCVDAVLVTAGRRFSAPPLRVKKHSARAEARAL